MVENICFVVSTCYAFLAFVYFCHELAQEVPTYLNQVDFQIIHGTTIAAYGTMLIANGPQPRER